MIYYFDSNFFFLNKNLATKYDNYINFKLMMLIEYKKLWKQIINHTILGKRVGYNMRLYEKEED